MKSLDFLEKLEKDYHNNIIGLYYRTSISKEYRDKLYDKYNKDFEKIKQDLEVLEIIKNKIVNVEILKFLIEEYGNDKALEIYNLDNIKLTKEELLKLKHWLEVNENE